MIIIPKLKRKEFFVFLISVLFLFQAPLENYISFMMLYDEIITILLSVYLLNKKNIQNMNLGCLYLYYYLYVLVLFLQLLIIYRKI